MSSPEVPREAEAGLGRASSPVAVSALKRVGGSAETQATGSRLPLVPTVKTFSEDFGGAVSGFGK